MLGLVAAVLLSGAASLAYQLSWTRRLSTVTSAAAYAQAIVLAVFFMGLALGAVLAGRRVARSARPLAVYAGLEVAVLVLSLGSIPAFGVFDRARSALSRSGMSPAGSLAVELALASTYMLAPSVLMGASLPFALEHAERILGKAVRRRFVSLLYGVNTLGAALGAALTGYVLIERIGLSRSTVFGAGLSLASAVAALAASRAAPAREVVREKKRPKRVPKLLLAAALGAGFVGLGAEVVWTRLYSLVVLNTVYAFTEVLVAVLLGIVAGAALARALSARMEGRDLIRAAGVAQASAAIAMACIAPLSLAIAGHAELEVALATGRSPGALAVLVLVLATPVALNAATLPLVVQGLAGARVSLSFTEVYAANTVGGVLGSLTAGFVLIPLLGVSAASSALEVLSLLVAAGLVWFGSERWRDPLAAFAPGVVVVLLHLLFPDTPRQIYEARIPNDARILELREGVVSDVMVTESRIGQRRLWINSSWVAGTGGGHKALGHLPALFVARPERAVGIALGTGQTFAAMFSNGVRELHVVDINPDVVGLSRTWFSEANDHLFEKRGVVVHQEDGRAFLRSRVDRFDLVVLEPLQAWSAGTSSLYSREFYEEARRVLAPGGVVAQWIPLYGQGVDETRAMVRTAQAVFRSATLWLDEHDGILLLHERSVELAPSEITARIEARGIAADLATKSILTSADALALLVLGPEGLDRWTAGAPILTDDRPGLEFAAAREIGEDAYAPIVESILTARGASAHESAAVAGATPEALDADAASDALLADALLPLDAFEPRAESLEHAIARAPSVAVLRARYRSVMEGWLSTLGRSHAPANTIEALLVRGVEHDGDYGEAMLNLAVLRARKNDLAGARGYVERAAKIDRVKDRANELLRTFPGR